MDFTAHASTPEHQDERRTLEAMMRTRKELVQAAINEGIDRNQVRNQRLLDRGHALLNRLCHRTQYERMQKERQQQR